MTTARGRRSATRAPFARGSAARPHRARAAADRSRARQSAAPRPPAPAAPTDRRPAIAASSASVVNPHRASTLNAWSHASQRAICAVRRFERLDRRMVASSISASNWCSTPSGIAASAGAGSPVTTVRPARAAASSSALVCVGATAIAIDAIATRSPQRAAQARSISAPIACASPSRRPRPPRSSTTPALPRRCQRGENSLAIAIGSSGCRGDRMQA